ncbi:MAG TPA: FHA domain-containing protein, partial [Bryobacteraceae bacterium]|nr:FHA domain-containing protein [Bryobacteraceae bacterium]
MPKLVSIAGPLCGGVFPLDEGDGTTFSIGRAVNNSLCIEDPSVSRHHCVVVRSGRQYQITDRGSVNRTYVNALPLEKHILRNGDEIKVGESLFLFLTEGDSDAEADDAAPTDQRIHLASTLVVRVPESLQAGQRMEAIQVSPAGSRYFEALLSMGQAVSSNRNPVTLTQELLDPLCRAIRAEHGTLVLAGPGVAETVAIYQWADPQMSAEPNHPAPLILERMMREP